MGNWSLLVNLKKLFNFGFKNKPVTLVNVRSFKIFYDFVGNGEDLIMFDIGVEANDVFVLVFMLDVVFVFKIVEMKFVLAAWFDSTCILSSAYVPVVISISFIGCVCFCPRILGASKH